MSTSPRRLGLYVPWALFALFCLCWTGYWLYAKDAAVKALDAAIANGGAHGVEASYGDVRAGGFPLRLTLTLTDARAATRMPALQIAAAALPVSINLSNPRHLIVGLAGGLRWTGESGAAQVLTTARGDLSIRVTSDGALARFSLDLEGAEITRAGAAATKIGKLLVHLRPDPRRAADAQLIVDAADWSGPTPFAALNGLSPFAHFRAAVAVTDYATLGTAQPLQTWSGALRVERFDVGYAGTQVTGDGALDLDALYRPVGTLTLTPAGAQPVALVAGEGWWTFAGLRVAPAKPLYAPSPPD